MIYVTTEFGPLAYDTSVFPGGEVFFRFKGGILRNDRYKIRADLHSSEDVMRLLMATDALRRAGVRHIDLVCPYFPAGLGGGNWNVIYEIIKSEAKDINVLIYRL